MNWSIRLTGPEDKPEVINFFKSSIWQHKKAEEFYRWKYEDNPCGYVRGWITVENQTQKTIGTYMMMPWRMEVNGKPILSSQCVDAVTDPDYQGQGMYTALGKRSVSELGNMDIPFSFAFPNKIALLGHRKVDWHEIGNLQRWVKPIKWDYILKKIFGDYPIIQKVGNWANKAARFTQRKYFSLLFPQFQLKEIEMFDETVDDFWKEVSPYFKVIGKRDSNYLNWKFINTPSKKRKAFLGINEGRVAGYAIIEMGDFYGSIVDLLTLPDKKVTMQFFYSLINYFLKKEVSAVSFTALEGNLYEECLKRCGFSCRPDKNPFVVHINSEEVNKETLLNPRNWFLTMGDCDVE